MSLFGPRLLLSQPRTLGEINKSSPYAQGLVSFGTTVNGVPRDFVNKVNFTRLVNATTSVPRVITDSRFTGVYATNAGVTGDVWDLTLPSPLKFSDRNEITIFAVAYSAVATASPRRRVFRFGTATSFLGAIDFSDISTNSFSALLASTLNTPKVSVSSITPVANTPYAVFVVRKAADYTFYVNGQAPTQSVSPAGGTSNNFVDIDRITLLGNSGGGTSPLNGGVLVYGFWNRALSAQEVYALSQNPWQLFQAIEPVPLAFEVSSGAQTNLTLSTTEGFSDVASFPVGVVGGARISATDTVDTAALNAGALVSLSMQASDPVDSAVLRLAALASATMSATDPADTALLNLAAGIAVRIQATDQRDIAVLRVDTGAGGPAETPLVGMMANMGTLLNRR